MRITKTNLVEQFQEPIKSRLSFEQQPLPSATFMCNAAVPARMAGGVTDEERYQLAASLVGVRRDSAAMAALLSLGMLPDNGQVHAGETESRLQAALRSKFPAQPLCQAPPRTAAAYPVLRFTSEEVKSEKGAFGPSMPKLKGAGLDGWRLEHIALLVLQSDQAAAAFARYASWLTADHVALGTTGPSERFMACLGSCRVFPFRKKVGSPDPRPPLASPVGSASRGADAAVACWIVT